MEVSDFADLSLAGLKSNFEYHFNLLRKAKEELAKRQEEFDIILLASYDKMISMPRSEILKEVDKYER